MRNEESTRHRSRQPRQRHADGIGCQVEPAAVASGSEVLLHQLQHAAHRDGSQKSPEEELPVVGLTMLTQILQPDDATGAAIHHYVDPLVDEHHIVEWGLRQERSERKNPYQTDADHRKRVFSDNLILKTHIYLQFWRKIKNYFILLQQNHEKN
jgi:hypothetical protein